MHRRNFIKNFTGATSLFYLNNLLNKRAFANDALKILTINIAKVTETWEEMAAKSRCANFILSKNWFTK